MKVITIQAPDLWGGLSPMRIVNTPPARPAVRVFAVCASWTSHLQAVKADVAGAALCGRKPPAYGGRWEWIGQGESPRPGTAVCRRCEAAAKKRQATR